MSDAPLPLSRFKVLDLTRVRAGPTCVRQLADWGADCIKIELPPSAGIKEGITGDRNGPDFQNLHRNKRSDPEPQARGGSEVFTKWSRAPTSWWRTTGRGEIQAGHRLRNVEGH